MLDVVAMRSLGTDGAGCRLDDPAVVVETASFCRPTAVNITFSQGELRHADQSTGSQVRHIGIGSPQPGHLILLDGFSELHHLSPAEREPPAYRDRGAGGSFLLTPLCPLVPGQPVYYFPHHEPCDIFREEGVERVIHDYPFCALI